MGKKPKINQDADGFDIPSDSSKSCKNTNEIQSIQATNEVIEYFGFFNISYFKRNQLLGKRQLKRAVACSARMIGCVNRKRSTVYLVISSYSFPFLKLIG
jgi:hypothetical protein